MTPFKPGFDPKWRDAEDYILGITRAIWEDRGIDTLTRYYGEDLIVRSPASIVQGNKGIIAATLATLAEFPDRALFGEDVMISDAGDGFLSSHRLICTATHSHPGAYGAPAGRMLSYRIIADCYCLGDRVRDEWLVRDQSAIVRQMGHDLADWVRHQIAMEGGPETCVMPFRPEHDQPGPYVGRGNTSQHGGALADALTRIMSADFAAISTLWDRAAEVHYAGGNDGFGHGAADRFWLPLRAAFPSATFTVHHIMGQEHKMMSPRAAVRWSLDGCHDGWGPFGAPTGAPVHVMGMTHAEFGPNGIRREWTLIDETAIWKQILLKTGQL